MTSPIRSWTGPIADGVANGVPTDLQIVVDTYEDLDAFRVGAAYAGVALDFFAGELVTAVRDQV